MARNMRLLAQTNTSVQQISVPRTAGLEQKYRFRKYRVADEVVPLAWLSYFHNRSQHQEVFLFCLGGKVSIRSI
jgi:hypothetical protein